MGNSIGIGMQTTAIIFTLVKQGNTISDAQFSVVGFRYFQSSSALYLHISNPICNLLKVAFFTDQ
jgi:hypothetical protein